MARLWSQICLAFSWGGAFSCGRRCSADVAGFCCHFWLQDQRFQGRPVLPSRWLRTALAGQRFLLPRFMATTWICRMITAVAISRWLQMPRPLRSFPSPFLPLDTLADLVYNRVKKEGRKSDVSNAKPITDNSIPQASAFPGPDYFLLRSHGVLLGLDLVSFGPPSVDRGVVSVRLALSSGGASSLIFRPGRRWRKLTSPEEGVSSTAR